MSHEEQLRQLEAERQKEIREKEALKAENALLKSLVEILNRNREQIKRNNETHS